MEINHKKEDTAKIAAYLRARSNEEVPVDDIMLNSGAERPHVYPILFEMEQDGIIEVTEREPLGTPSKVRLLEKPLI
ncbi:hypothetical protein [Phocaeicola plebeius]|uniref:hypothetical protein n=1 Tax=Phocaeicola plebeius TaxID=310297 RepID=UPI0026EA5052|nr:hypothetical protein [Phocaeicola plebeius]